MAIGVETNEYTRTARRCNRFLWDSSKPGQKALLPRYSIGLRASEMRRVRTRGTLIRAPALQQKQDRG